jgi:NADH pyrophosphatase NudC (nudix superfamily)
MNETLTSPETASGLPVPSTPLLGLLIQNKTHGEVAEIIEADDTHVWLRGTRLTSRSHLNRRVKYTTLMVHWSADVECCPRCGLAMHRSSMGFACYRRDCRTGKTPVRTVGTTDTSKPNNGVKGADEGGVP